MTDEWDKVFASRRWGRWPNTRFVEWFMRKFGNVPDRGKVDVLELGCGTGAQIRFLHEEGFHAIGIDQSERAALKVTEFGAAALIGDIRDLSEFLAEYDLGPFDCIVDVCTLQHLSAVDAEITIADAHCALKPGGHIFSMFAAEGSDTDAFGSDVPAPRLLPAREIEPLFAGFELKVGLEIVQVPTSLDDDRGANRQHWIIEGRKRDAV